MKEYVVLALLISGATFTAIAAIGILRMPDLYTRMQSATKSGVLGGGLVLASVAVYFADAAVAARAVAAIAFIALTTPIAGHLIGRAAYFVGVPLWEKNVLDELRGHYDPRTHALDGEEMRDEARERR